MRIKWLILLIFIFSILASTASAQEMVRSVRQRSVEQAQPVVIDVNTVNIGRYLTFDNVYTTKTGPQEFQISISVINANNLANMDLSIRFAIQDEYQANARDYGRLRIKNVEKGPLIDKSLFDSKIEDTWTYCKGNFMGQCTFERVNISFVSTTGVSGNGPIAIVTYTVDLPSDSGITIPLINPTKNYDPIVAFADPEVVNAHDTSGNRIDIPLQKYSILVWKNAMKGDGDGDGVVTGKDAVAALAIAVGKQPYNPIYDMNDDGKVDSTDVIEILKLSIQSSGAQQGVSPEHGG